MALRKGPGHLRLAASVMRCHDTPPGVPESSERRAELATLIRLMQADLDAEDASAVPSIVENVVSETPFTERAARNLNALLPKLGRAAYDMAIKVITDVGSATAKKILGLP